MKSKLSLTLLSIGLTAASANAAVVISYAGVDYNVDAKGVKPTNPQTIPFTNQSGGWRTTTDVKTLDIDADNVYGTDGYYLRGGQTIPAYVTGATELGGGGNNYGSMDNPDTPTGVDDFAVGFWGQKTTAASLDLFSFTVAGTDLTGQTLRLGVHFDTFQTGNFVYTWSQVTGSTAGVGGTVVSSASSDTVTAANNGYDFAFFDVKGATAGDTFRLSVTDDKTSSEWLYYDGVTFDTKAVPEPSTALLGGLGILLLLRRRRA